MFSIFFFIFIRFVYTKNNFPSVKFTKGGIFGWFDALGLMKKPFNNKKLFGFRVNSTSPDLSMIVYDIVNHLNLHDANVSQKINEYFNNDESKAELLDDTTFSEKGEKSSYLFEPFKISLDYEKEEEKVDFLNEKSSSEKVDVTENRIEILSGKSCSEKTGNSKQFCKMFGNSLDFEKIGITEANLNILIGNIVGYIPTNLFFIIIASLSIIYYIVQIVLQYKIFKPVEYSEPSVYSIVIFYCGDALIFISAILFFCSFTGVDHFISTVTSLDTVIPRISYSVADSLIDLFEEKIPNSFEPIFQAFDRILNNMHYYLKTTIDSFINPTSIFSKKMVSNDENDLGVFNIYNNKIHPLANQFYQKVKTQHSNLNLPQYYMSRDFSSEQEKFEEFMGSENDLSTQLNQLDTFFVYFHFLAQQMETYFVDFANLTSDDNENKTIGESLRDLKNESLNNFEFLTELHRKTKKKNPLWIFLAIIFFTIGLFFILYPIFLGLIFWMHNKVARCVANTVSICPLVSTILMFALSFLMTGIGFALVAISNQFEIRVDDLISNIIDITIPTREIVFNPLNITEQTNGNYDGVLYLSSILFPSEKDFDFFEKFTQHDESDGIATALNFNKIIDMNKYGDEIGDFMINLSGKFNLPKNVLDSLNAVQAILRTFDSFPSKIDGFFNWGISMTRATNDLRNKINSQDPSAMSDLEPYLNEIDVLTKQMNSQFEIAMHQLTNILPNSINQLNTVVPRFIKSVMNELGNTTKSLARTVYPFVDSIKCGMILGPYALARNVIFYDLANMCAFISASGTLMIFGLDVVVTLIWIRRKGMIYVEGREIGFFEFFTVCCKKKVANDHSCDSMETDDSNIIYLHDSDFEISTSRCANDFVRHSDSSNSYFKNESYEDCHNWCINDNYDDSSISLTEPNHNNENDVTPDVDCKNFCLNEDQNGNYIPEDGYNPDPVDDCNNWCLNEDQNGNYIPKDGYICDPVDDCNNWCLIADQNGNYIPKDGYICDPVDDCSNWCLNADQNGNCIPDNNGFKCDPEDDNANFIVRLDRDGKIYSNKFDENHPIGDSINDVGTSILDSMNIPNNL